MVHKGFVFTSNKEWKLPKGIYEILEYLHQDKTIVCKKLG